MKLRSSQSGSSSNTQEIGVGGAAPRPAEPARSDRRHRGRVESAAHQHRRPANRPQPGGDAALEQLGEPLGALAIRQPGEPGNGSWAPERSSAQPVVIDNEQLARQQLAHLAEERAAVRRHPQGHMPGQPAPVGRLVHRRDGPAPPAPRRRRQNVARHSGRTGSGCPSDRGRRPRGAATARRRPPQTGPAGARSSRISPALERQQNELARPTERGASASFGSAGAAAHRDCPGGRRSSAESAHRPSSAAGARRPPPVSSSGADGPAPKTACASPGCRRGRDGPARTARPVHHRHPHVIHHGGRSLLWRSKDLFPQPTFRDAGS